MNESEAMRFEDALTLDAQDAKTVIERYYQLCDGDNTPSQFALWPTRSLGGGWEALPGEPEPNKAAIAQLVAELPRGRYPRLIVDSGRIPVWRRKCLLENVRHELLGAGRSYASLLNGNRTITPLTSVALDAFLGVPNVSDGTFAVRLVDDLYPYDLKLTDEVLGIKGAYGLYPDVMKKTGCFVDSNWAHVRKLLSRVWKTRLEGLYIHRAMEALGSDESQWVDASVPDAATRLSVQVMTLAHELLAAECTAVFDSGLSKEEADARGAQRCRSIGEGLVELGLTPTYFDSSTGRWKQ